MLLRSRRLLERESAVTFEFLEVRNGGLIHTCDGQVPGAVLWVWVWSGIWCISRSVDGDLCKLGHTVVDQTRLRLLRSLLPSELFPLGHLVSLLSLCTSWCVSGFTTQVRWIGSVNSFLSISMGLVVGGIYDKGYL